MFCTVFCARLHFQCGDRIDQDTKATLGAKIVCKKVYQISCLTDIML